MLDFTQFDRLVSMLDEAGITCQVYEQAIGGRVLKYRHGSKRLSVAINPITMGHKDGLLETWIESKRREPTGFQTAEDAFKKIQEREAYYDLQKESSLS